MTYYDDNFGYWDDMDDPDMQEFYEHIQRTNVKKVCKDCGRTVWIQPHYAICDPCATRREQGFGP